MEIDSLKKLNAYIAEVKSIGNVNPDLITYTEIFKTKSFETNLYRLCQRHYMGIAFGHEAANCFTESENARLYRDPQGPKANNKLHVAGEKIIQNTTKAFKTIMTSDNRNAKKTTIPNLPVNDINTDNVSTLSKSIVPYMCNKAIEQHRIGKDYYRFYTELNEEEKKIFLVKNFRTDYLLEDRGPRPIYHQTHTIIADKILVGDSYFWRLKCDCMYFPMHKCPCRHLYTIFNRAPIKEDFYPECTHLYAKWFAEPEREVFTAKCLEIRNTLKVHGGLLLPLPLNDLGPRDIDWSREDTHRQLFEDGLGKLNDVNPHTFLEEYLTLEDVTSSDQKPHAFTLNRGGRGSQTPYSYNMAKYQQMMSLVTSKADQAKVDFHFNQCIQELYGGKRSVTEEAKVVAGQVPSSDNAGKLVSGPNLETCPNKRRLTNSPEKKRPKSSKKKSKHTKKCKV
jgi:hypothetical protein